MAELSNNWWPEDSVPAGFDDVVEVCIEGGSVFMLRTPTKEDLGALVMREDRPRAEEITRFECTSIRPLVFTVYINRIPLPHADPDRQGAREESRDPSGDSRRSDALDQHSSVQDEVRRILAEHSRRRRK